MPHLPDHQTDHDPLLIAAYAAGDAEGPDLESAQALIAGCEECGVLHRDLRAIAAAVPAVPAAARTRDFRLTTEQAESLRVSGWRRLLAPLAGPRFAFAAPLGGTLAALGLAGVLIAGAAATPIASTGAGQPTSERMAVTSSTEPGGAALSGPASEQASPADVYLAAPAPAASQAAIAPAAGGAAAAAPAASEVAGSGDAVAAAAAPDVASPEAVAGPLDETTTVAAPPASGLPAFVPILSVAFLVVGLGLLVVGLVGRRARRTAA